MIFDILNFDGVSDSHDPEACVVTMNWIATNFVEGIQEAYAKGSPRLVEAESVYNSIWEQMKIQIEEHRLTLSLVHAVTNKKHFFSGGNASN